MSTGMHRMKTWMIGAGIGGACVALIATSVVVARTGGTPRRMETVKVSVGPPVTPITIAAAQARPDAGVPEVSVDDVDHAARASDLIAEGDAEGAISELDKAIAQAPDDVDLHWKLARLAPDARGDKALGEVARLRPTDPEPVQEQAKRRLEANDFAGAVAAAKEAVKRGPKSWETHHLLGRAYMGDGRLPQAIAAFRKAGQQGGAPSYPFNNLGFALLLSGRPEEALEALDVAVERGPVTHFMMNNLGLAYERLGRYDDAEMAFLGALELKPDYVKAKVNLERIDDAKEQVAKAEEGTDDPALTLPAAPEDKPGEEPKELHGG